jgi:RNA polymerase sigma factor (TIGR02999 family)
MDGSARMPHPATSQTNVKNAKDVTRLLKRWGEQGDVLARDRLLDILYTQLHEMALSRVGHERGRTLRPTALVHEALLRLIESDVDYRDRVHFLSLAALKMRSVLVDHARTMAAAKRGGGDVHLTLSQADLQASASRDEEFEVLALNRALEHLAELDPRVARVVEWMYFGGMSREEIAAGLDVSVPTVDRDLRFGKAWLNRHLAEPASRT